MCQDAKPFVPDDEGVTLIANLINNSQEGNQTERVNKK